MKIETGKANQAHTRHLMHFINSTNGKMMKNNPLLPDVPFHPGPVYRPPPKPIRPDMSNQEDSKGLSSINNISPVEPKIFS